MYPATWLGLFPPYPRSPRVFVAMSFDPRFRERYEVVIAPAVADVGLEPYRVDASNASDSIITDILEGIATSCLILADITSHDGHRNGNVMYELGIAHACRQAQEVLMFRSDRGKLPFDLNTVRVFDYDPDRKPAAARSRVANMLSIALSEVDRRRGYTVQRAADSLDIPAIAALATADGALAVGESLGITSWHPFLPDVAGTEEGRRGVTRLLELGLLTARYRRSYPSTQSGHLNWYGRPLSEVLNYALTQLGEDVLREIAGRFGVTSPAEDS